MKGQYHIFWELFLIIASVLIFRSGRLLLDTYFRHIYGNPPLYWRDIAFYAAIVHLKHTSGGQDEQITKVIGRTTFG